MLKMRLQRRGKTGYATYRVVVAEQRAPIKGRFIADLGPYNPHTNEFKVNKEVVLDWLGKGVQASPTVHNLLITHGVIKGEKMTSWRPKVKEAAEDEEGAEGGEKSDEKTETQENSPAPEQEKKEDLKADAEEKK